MTRGRLRAAAVLAAAALLFLAAGCGRKAKPEPRSHRPAAIACRITA